MQMRTARSFGSIRLKKVTSILLFPSIP
jgi:hypothetical protein